MRIKLLMVFLSLPFLLFSAGPVLHLWVAEKFCEIFSITGEDAVKIIIGTEFPDIRYLAHLPREATHPNIISFKEVIQSATPFECGMKLHAWLDIVRENFVLKANIYEEVLPYSEELKTTFLKCIEDEILSDYYDGMRWVKHFDIALPEEMGFAQREVVMKWHDFIQASLMMRPSWYLWGQSFIGPAFGASAETLFLWSFLLPQLKEKFVFRMYLNSLCEHIEDQMQKFADSF